MALVALLFMTTMAAQAVSVTYSLTTHPVVSGTDGYGTPIYAASRTMTQTATQAAGADLSLPKDMRRGYTTYTYYSDPELTEEITKVPSSDATVYVDYLFDSPTLISTAEYKQGYFICNGYLSSTRTRLQKDGKTYTTGYSTLTNDPYYIYGDCYNIFLYTVKEQKYLTWNGTNNRKLVSTPPQYGWQLVRNYDRNDNPRRVPSFSLGSYSETSNTGEYYLCCPEDGKTSTSRLLPKSQITFNTNNEIPQGSSANTGARMTRTYSYLDGGLATSGLQVFFFVVQNYPTYGKIRTAGPYLYEQTFRPYRVKETGIPAVVKKGLWGDGTTTEGALFNEDVYSYRFFKDAALTQEYGLDEYTEGTSSSEEAKTNVKIYVEESLRSGHEEAFISDRWITLCLPYAVPDVEERFGLAEDGTPAVIVNKFTGLSVSGNKYNLLFENVSAMRENTPYMFKVKSALDGKYLTLYNTATPPIDSENPDEDEKYLSVEYADNNAVVSMRGTYQGRTLTASTDDCYTFFMGYTQSNDPTASNYNPNWKDETPKFYKVTDTRNVEIKPFRCWFDIKDLNPASGVKTLSIVTESETGIRSVVNPDGTQTPVGHIYNMSGQLVRANATDTDGLPKGLYIMDGRKIAIR